MEASLYRLLDHLAHERPTGPRAWREWQIEPVLDTLSGSTFRVVGAGRDLGIKFFTRDSTDRAGREHACLSALSRAGLRVAPAPVLLERERYERPVVVRTWLTGEPVDPVPEDDQAWEAIVSHLLAVHSVGPETVPENLRVSLPDAGLTMRSAREGLQGLRQHLARESRGSEPTATLVLLLDDLERSGYPSWPTPRPALCRGDCNRFNFLLRGSRPDRLRCLSFDWEYGGWGDAAFELADLLCAPTFVGTPPGRKRWLVERYADRSGDEGLPVRTETYEGLMQAWWAIRFARFLRETEEGPGPANEERRERARSAYEGRLALAWETLRRS